MYNFSKMELVCTKLLDKVTSSNLRELKTELNKLFNDSKCIDVIYTNNDKLFFGMSVIPTLNSTDFVRISQGKNRRFDSYILELDSKLFDKMLNLNEKQLVALLLHEIGHVVNNTAVSNELTKGINYHIGAEGITIDYKEAMQSSEILNIGLLRAIRKITSIFEKNDEEFIADEFVVKCGYGKELEEVYDKIITNRDCINKDVSNKFIVLIWAISVHSDMKARNRAIADNLDQSSKVESSSVLSGIYKKAIKNLLKTKNKVTIVNNLYLEDCNAIINESNFIKNIKYYGIKTIEDDLYEYNIKINMIEDNIEALDLLRNINIKINLIESFIQNSKNKLPEKEKERYFSIQRKYISLRDTLVNQGTYDKQSYGLFVKYPKISRSRG